MLCTAKTTANMYHQTRHGAFVQDVLIECRNTQSLHGSMRTLWTSCSGIIRSESYDGAGAEFTRQELRALFDVIGTPTWADIEDVQSSPWRRYLEARHAPSRQAQKHICVSSVTLPAALDHERLPSQHPPDAINKSCKTCDVACSAAQSMSVRTQRPWHLTSSRLSWGRIQEWCQKEEST